MLGSAMILLICASTFMCNGPGLACLNPFAEILELLVYMDG
jgi:hypothetical protein